MGYPYAAKAWANGEDGNTPVSADALIDVETRLSAYADKAPALGSRIIQKLRAETENIAIMVVGDSTSNWSTAADDSKWPIRLLTYLGQRFPRWTIKHKQWNGSFYQLTTTVQTGSSGRTLFLFNTSWGSVGPRWHQAAPSQMWWEPLDPGSVGGTPDVTGVDMLIINHGHNAGAGFTTPQSWFNELACLTELAHLIHPGSEVVVTAQNPRIGSDYQQTNALETQRYAHMRGYGFLNIWQTFVDNSPNGTVVADPTAGALMDADGIHPNTTGHDLWGLTLAQRFQVKPSFTRSQQASSLSQSAPSSRYLLNGDFQLFAAGSAPPGWTGSNATFALDATNWETGRSNSAVRLTTTSTGSPSYMSQSLSNFKALAGRRVTVAARVRVPSSISSANAGAVSIVETGGANAGESMSTLVDPVRGGRDAFIWIMASRHIGNAATGVAVRLYANAASEAAVSGDITVDRIVVSRDRLPHDLDSSVISVSRVPHTWAVYGAIAVPVGDTDFIPPMTIPVATNPRVEVVKLIGVNYSLNNGAAGTTVTFKMQTQGSDIVGMTGLTTPNSNAVSSTTFGIGAEKWLTPGATLAPVVTAIAGAPKNLSITAVLEYSTIA